MPTVSNEAEELHRMCSTLAASASNSPTFDALSRLFEVSPESAEYMFFVGAIQLRFDRFLKVANSSIAAERHRGRVQNAVGQLRQFTSYRYWQISWRDTIGAVFQETHLIALDMAGGGLADAAPVIYLSPDERREHAEKLKKAFEELGEPETLFEQMVATSLNTAIKMIDLFDIFGSVIVSEKLLEATAFMRQAAEVAAPAKRNRLLAVVAVVSVILNGVTVADSHFTALENFYGRAHSAVEMLSRLPTLKLLPAPTEQQKEEDNGDVTAA